MNLNSIYNICQHQTKKKIISIVAKSNRRSHIEIPPQKKFYIQQQSIQNIPNRQKYKNETEKNTKAHFRYERTIRQGEKVADVLVCRRGRFRPILSVSIHPHT